MLESRLTTDKAYFQYWRLECLDLVYVDVTTNNLTCLVTQLIVIQQNEYLTATKNTGVCHSSSHYYDATCVRGIMYVSDVLMYLTHYASILMIYLLIYN